MVFKYSILGKLKLQKAIQSEVSEVSNDTKE